MGYKLIKRSKGGPKPVERFTIRKDRIYFSKALYERLGLHLRKKCVLMYIDTDSGCLCFDFKDMDSFPDAYPVCTHVNTHASMTCMIYCHKAMENYGIPHGEFHFTDRDGSIYKTDCIVKDNSHD